MFSLRAISISIKYIRKLPVLSPLSTVLFTIGGGVGLGIGFSSKAFGRSSNSMGFITSQAFASATIEY